MKTPIRLGVGAAICAAILFIAAFSFLPILVQADTDAEKAIKKAEDEVDKAEKAAQEAGKAQKDADEAMKKTGTEKTPEDKAADDAAKAADAAAEAADEAQDKAQKEQLEAEDAALDAKSSGGNDEEKNKKAADEKKEADDAAAEAKKAEEDASKKEKEANEADKKADDADKKIENRDVKKKKADARLKRRRARAARRAAAKAIREARRLLHEATRVGEGSKSEERKKRLDDLDGRLKGLKKLEEDARKSEEPLRNFIPPGADQTAESKTANGLSTVTFPTAQGRIILNLPDDVRAGDTISGTVFTEPKGNTDEEKANNQKSLDDYVLDLAGTKIQTGRPTFRWTPVIPEPSMPVRYQVRIIEVLGRPIPEGTTLPGAVITPNPTTMPGTEITPNPNTTPNFNIPPLGQTGRPIVITGPFDGDASNTTINATVPRTSVPDSEKGTENVSERFGLLAESPRKAVFQSPTNVTGPIQITVKEGDTQTTGNYRNVGVNLSAPKTNLLKGEQTELKVEVIGLEGIKEPVPLTLECKGVITMEGGIYQPLVIQPSQVGADGRYSTTRGITGVQAGGWAATATVVTNRFDVSLQDDSVPTRRVLWDTFTGDYIFTNFPPRLPGQPPSTGSTTSGSLTGRGKLKMKGCIITLTHNAPDRRVFSRLDTCNKTGDASVQTTSPQTNLTITDKNTTDSVP